MLVFILTMGIKIRISHIASISTAKFLLVLYRIKSDTQRMNRPYAQTCPQNVPVECPNFARITYDLMTSDTLQVYSGSTLSQCTVSPDLAPRSSLNCCESTAINLTMQVVCCLGSVDVFYNSFYRLEQTSFVCGNPKPTSHQIYSVVQFSSI